MTIIRTEPRPRLFPWIDERKFIAEEFYLFDNNSSESLESKFDSLFLPHQDKFEKIFVTSRGIAKKPVTKKQGDVWYTVVSITGYKQGKYFPYYQNRGFSETGINPYTATSPIKINNRIYNAGETWTPS